MPGVNGATVLCHQITGANDQQTSRIQLPKGPPLPHAPLFLIESKKSPTALCGVHAPNVQAQHAECWWSGRFSTRELFQQKIAGLHTGLGNCFKQSHSNSKSGFWTNRWVINNQEAVIQEKKHPTQTVAHEAAQMFNTQHRQESNSPDLVWHKQKITLLLHWFPPFAHHPTAPDFLLLLILSLSASSFFLFFIFIIPSVALHTS